MPLLVLSEPAVATPEAARKLARPIVFIQGNIHAGEVEGKEAALIIARRLTQGDLRPMLKQLVVLIAPIYNADGNEKFSLQNRTAQYGPIAGVGTRENSKGLDLNRDHMKLDSAEARAFVGLLNRWDPHVGIDLHTTNGSYHGYHLTYSPSLNPNADARLIALARERILPAMADGVLKKHNFRTYYYGNFASESGKPGPSRVDPSNPGDTDVANIRSSPALQQQLSWAAQSPCDPVRSLQLRGFWHSRAGHRSVRRRGARRGSRQRKADHDADRATRQRNQGVRQRHGEAARASGSTSVLRRCPRRWTSWSETSRRRSTRAPIAKCWQWPTRSRPSG